MSERTDRLKRDLDGVLGEWAFSDEGNILIAPTKADFELVLKRAAEFPLEDLLMDVAAVVSDAIATDIEAHGLRPADYWKTTVAEVVTKRLGKVLSEAPAEVVSLVQGTLKGRG